MGLPFEGRDGLQNLALKVWRDISTGCDQALADLGSQENFGFRRGEIWGLWVRKLTTILSKAELPTQVRKDADKTNAAKPSAFVSFLRELQECIPKDYRRSQAHGPDFEPNIALSVAIVRARQSAPRVTKTLSDRKE
jgi:hypothetical protein